MNSNAFSSFRGQTALILHDADRDQRALVAQLSRLGLIIEQRCPMGRHEWPQVDICFFDADRCRNHTFPWTKGEPRVPLIAIMGSETPERIQWSLSHGTSAFLVKPIRSSGTYLALVTAIQSFAQRRSLLADMRELQERVRARRLLFKALLKLMISSNLTDDEAFEKLRLESMRCQVSMEELCLTYLRDEISSYHSSALGHAGTSIGRSSKVTLLASRRPGNYSRSKKVAS